MVLLEGTGILPVKQDEVVLANGEELFFLIRDAIQLKDQEVLDYLAMSQLVRIVLTNIFK